MAEQHADSGYKGHTIWITASLSHGLWRWSYVLDGKDLQEMGGHGTSSADLAISEAQDDARHRIDNMM